MKWWIHFCCLKRNLASKSQRLSETYIKVLKLKKSVLSFKNISLHIQVAI